MKTYTFQATSHPDLFRVVDRKGDWTHYLHQPTNTYLPAVSYILQTGYAQAPRLIQYIKNHTADEIERRLESAGERGDRVHQFIRVLFDAPLANLIDRRAALVLAEDHQTIVELSDDEWDCILAFEQFWTRHDCALIAYEFPVWNLRFEYAGTADALIRLRKDCGIKTCGCKDFIGQLALVDWKSSKGIWEQYGSQVAAYSFAENLKPILGDQKIAYTAIVRLGTQHKSTGGCEFEPYDARETTIHLAEFFGAQCISQAHVKPFDPEKDIKEIPETLSLVIERENLLSTPIQPPVRARKVGTRAKKTNARSRESIRQ